MKAIIFGHNGQDGHYLGELMQSKGVEVMGISRGGGSINGNVADLPFVEKSIREYLPDYIFHFAANSTTKHLALFENHNSISSGTLNILESVRIYSPSTRVFLSGSAMQFKNEGQPINENTPFEANSPYAIARIQSTYAGRYYRNCFGLKVYTGYFFNHDSPLRTENHINQKIVRIAQQISAGRNELLEIGNIHVEKEFNFAGDLMEAIWILVNQDEIYEAVIGSGIAHSIEDWARSCFETVNLDFEKYLQLKNDFKAEYKILVSDPKVILSLGWKPKMDFNSLVKLMMIN